MLKVLKCFSYLDEFFEPLPVVDVSDLLAEDPVEQQGDGVGKGCGEDHEELGDVDGARADRQSVSRADGLRHDLAEDDDAHGRADHGYHPRG